VERFREEAHIGHKPDPGELISQSVGPETQPDGDPKSR
jgi:cytochrome c oxidase subunit 1